jgi:hypothetical protein
VHRFDLFLISLRTPAKNKLRSSLTQPETRPGTGRNARATFGNGFYPASG